MGLNYKVVNQTENFAMDGSLQAHVDHHRVHFLSYANANIQHADQLAFHRGVHVVRDPRDMLVSGYFSHKNTHDTSEWPALIRHRDKLQQLSKEEGLMLEMEFSRPFFEDMLTWNYEQENVLELRMEDVTANPVDHFLAISDFLGILDERTLSRTQKLLYSLMAHSNRLNHRGRRFMPGRLPVFPTPRRQFHALPPEMVKMIVERWTFERLTGRKKGQEDRGNHLRKGIPGDWKNHFTADHVTAFKQKYNDLILKLGYETSPDWRPY
jgi:hypothetical protein